MGAVSPVDVLNQLFAYFSCTFSGWKDVSQGLCHEGNSRRGHLSDVRIKQPARDWPLLNVGTDDQSIHVYARSTFSQSRASSRTCRGQYNRQQFSFHDLAIEQLRDCGDTTGDKLTVCETEESGPVVD